MQVAPPFAALSAALSAAPMARSNPASRAMIGIASEEIIKCTSATTTRDSINRNANTAPLAPVIATTYLFK
ncbi:secreted protein [Candidatus Magnetobacterium bavaricum]|uniref:Secreted protein n=1 Tax=Candidatus Magnetobacterium bavaricum TaxID=29290 RepID=A0A0F3H099_9BACT|nr:secreted protein [Candidatus Magnetobacterium bavaricum]